MGHKGHWGEYTGNAKWSRDHAHTKVTSKNYDDAVKDDAAHIDYLKRDIDYDNKHGHSDENMTADEKHISKLAGDMKYDKEHHGSPSRYSGDRKNHDMGEESWKAHKKTMHGIREHGGPSMHHSPATNKVEGMTHEELAKFSENRPLPAGGKTGYEKHMEMHQRNKPGALNNLSPARREGYDNPDGYEDEDFRKKAKKAKRNAAANMHCMGKK